MRVLRATYPRFTVTTRRAVSTRTNPIWIRTTSTSHFPAWSRNGDSKTSDSSTETFGLAGSRGMDPWQGWSHLCGARTSRSLSHCSPLLIPERSVDCTYFAAAGGVPERPTESQEDVVADRSEEDPLPPEKHRNIPLPSGGAGPKPTESEEDVVADRSDEDPLLPEKHHTTKLS